MKTPLHLYTKEALIILRECLFYHAATNPLTIAFGPDGELQAVRDIYDPDKEPPVAIGTIARYLEQYARNSMVGGSMYVGGVGGGAKVADKVKCIRLIVLGKDESAKKRYPAAYEKLKGKPMNPMQVAEVSILIQELAKLDKEIADDFGKYGRFWSPMGDCNFDFKCSVDELVTKIRAIRGY